MKPRYPMTEVIARREYEITRPEGQASCVVSIGTPAPIPDDPQCNWYCPWQIVSPDWSREFYAGGVDSLQALLLAISIVRVHLQSDSSRSETLTWLGEESLGLDLLPDPPAD